MANETLREAANRANPNGMNDILRSLAVGDLLTQRLPRVMRAEVPLVADVILAAPLTCDRIRLPTACKASRIRRAWARASGGGALGEMTIHALGANPGANEIAVAPNGDIVTRNADLYTSIDVDYEPLPGKLITIETLPVTAASGVCTLPAWVVALHPHLLVAGTSTAGGLVQEMVTTWRAAAAPNTTFACLNLIGTIVYFAIADAVTSCSLTLLVDGDVPDPQDLLTSDNTSNV